MSKKMALASRRQEFNTRLTKIVECWDTALCILFDAIMKKGKSAIGN